MTLCRLTYAVLPLALLSLNICVSAQESVNQAPVPQAPAGKINIVSETPGNLPAFETFKAEKNNNAAAEIKGAEAILQENSKENQSVSPSEIPQEEVHSKSTLMQFSQEEQKKIDRLIKEAEIYLYGDGVPVNLQKASELYSAAGELGSPKAKLRLSTMYRQGQGVQKDLNRAFELVMEAANQDFAPAQSALSGYFRNGIGVEKDLEQADYWLGKAAENGHRRSKVLYSSILEKDISNSASLEKAKRFTEEVKREASPQEIYSIGYGYANGIGFPMDLNKAIEWAKLGAEKGEVNSIYLLGECYWRKNNIPEAIVWFEKAAEKGLKAAQLQTGRLYRDGAPGLEKNIYKALDWLEKAYPVGDKSDIFSLIVMRVTGPKTIRDIAKGQEWLDRYIQETQAKELIDKGEKYWNGENTRRNFNLGGALALAALQKGDRSSVCSFAEKLGTKNWRKADFVTAYSLLNQCVIDNPDRPELKKAFDSLQERMSSQQLEEAQGLDSNDALGDYLSKNAPKLD